MFESNDNIQSLSFAFGERFFLQSAWSLYEDCKHQGAKTILQKVLKLHMVDLLNKELGFYLTNGLISHKLGTAIQNSFADSVKELVPHINECIESFGINNIPEIHAPMARNWSNFND